MDENLEAVLIALEQKHGPVPRKLIEKAIEIQKNGGDEFLTAQEAEELYKKVLPVIESAHKVELLLGDEEAAKKVWKLRNHLFLIIHRARIDASDPLLSVMRHYRRRS